MSNMSDDEQVKIELPKDSAKYIDEETFEQILEMDDDDPDREFSRGLVFGFFDQAKQTLTEMDDKLEEKDVQGLSSLGHFLKGSSATLGIFKVKDICEKIQHWGALKDENGVNEISEEKALAAIKKSLPTMKKDFEEAEAWLRKFYGPEPGNDS